MTDDELKRLLEANAADTRRAMERGFAAVNERFDAADARFIALEATVNTRFETVNTRFEAVDARFTALQTHVDESAAETRHQIGLAREATKHQVEVVAESVLQTREELRTARAALDEKIEHTSAETQSMIKFSHQELDRRMTALEASQRTLEETVTDLQTRVERLESGTH